MMKVLIDYEGRSVRLTDERKGHILTHPEMESIIGRLEFVLQNPEQVVKSSSDPDARLYYRYLAQSPVGAKHLCIVVKIKEADAFVITAYLTDSTKKGALLWPAEK